ncbi:GNAT family N-acetyltransferase [Clostridium botulinum]|uniref:GNAT family N-acetyltransferase n=1 Tax=Clostridium botulinum TaxID=1491 RepID=A0ABC8CQU2_CLOBO|nr:GNAT family N-acetyltransferase [Clostridium botulinum]AVQ38050.1 GNAT family N-acetyltransferase [Clostridium botulinum]EKO1914051.1 GNAT family N-acetyltransferase [Clostridium botulinum]EKO2044106.1 GNAT family N-acetyltransferase [Clostridium botulinum]EKS4345303.1 GNAT family N-acetyltransferase [Clostridium botulinum]EKS4393953.1 GNAT family N-acetyltransferase [Clostridium botulinum]
MNNYIIRESSSEKEADLIVDRIVEYNLSKVPGKQEVPLLCINRVIEDTNGEIIAGILSNMYCWNCIYIDALWVKEEYRKDGLGTKLLKELEKIAKEKDCHLIHLDTFDFQAKDFYIRHGYEIFGVLDQCPENHKRYFMKKNI